MRARRSDPRSTVRSRTQRRGEVDRTHAGLGACPFSSGLRRDLRLALRLVRQAGQNRRRRSVACRSPEDHCVRGWPHREREPSSPCSTSRSMRLANPSVARGGFPAETYALCRCGQSATKRSVTGRTSAPASTAPKPRAASRSRSRRSGSIEADPRRRGSCAPSRFLRSARRRRACRGQRPGAGGEDWIRGDALSVRPTRRAPREGRQGRGAAADAVDRSRARHGRRSAA